MLSELHHISVDTDGEATVGSQPADRMQELVDQRRNSQFELLKAFFFFLSRKSFSLEFVAAIKACANLFTVEFRCQTQGPRADSGPPRHLMWPLTA